MHARRLAIYLDYRIVANPLSTCRSRQQDKQRHYTKNTASHGPIMSALQAPERACLFVMDQSANVGPELLKRVARHSRQEAEAGAKQGVLPIGLTLLAPGIGEEVIARRREISRIRRHCVSIPIPRKERPLDDVSEAAAIRFARGPRIARIFTPHCAESGFHRVARYYAGEPHAVAVAKALPMRSIFARPV